MPTLVAVASPAGAEPPTYIFSLKNKVTGRCAYYDPASVTAGEPRCMEVDPGSMNVRMAPCNPRNHLQRFRWDHSANPTRFISLYNDLGSTMCIYDNGAYVERGDCLVDETEVWYWNG